MRPFLPPPRRDLKRRQVDWMRLGAHLRRPVVGVLLQVGIGTAALDGADKQDFVKFSKSELLTFDDLLQLEQTDPPAAPLAAHLDKLLHTPFVSSEAYLSGAKPKRPSSPTLGPNVRDICWNIDRGIRFDVIRTALAEPEKFDLVLADKKKPKSKTM